MTIAMLYNPYNITCIYEFKIVCDLYVNVQYIPRARFHIVVVIDASCTLGVY